MEVLTREAFLHTDFTGDGSGFGYGSGVGFGDDGSGFGDDGSGFGAGDGFGGSGFGYGYGACIKTVNRRQIYYIDEVPTAIDQVRGGIAFGAILHADLSFSPCYVVKQDGYFAHGDTLHSAMAALRDKLFDDLPEEDRIAAFIDEHKPGERYPNTDLYEWHHRLTGSCEAGRKAFAKNHGIDMDGNMTPEEFIRLTRNAYGGDVIRKLEVYYHI